MKKKVLALIFLVTVLSSLLIGCDGLNYTEVEKNMIHKMKISIQCLLK